MVAKRTIAGSGNGKEGKKVRSWAETGRMALLDSVLLNIY